MAHLQKGSNTPTISLGMSERYRLCHCVNPIILLGMSSIVHPDLPGAYEGCCCTMLGSVESKHTRKPCCSSGLRDSGLGIQGSGGLGFRDLGFR